MLETGPRRFSRFKQFFSRIFEVLTSEEKALISRVYRNLVKLDGKTRLKFAPTNITLAVYLIFFIAFFNLRLLGKFFFVKNTFSDFFCKTKNK